MVDLSRREFMLAGTTSLLSLSGDTAKQVTPPDGDDFQFQGVADLMGPRDARPEPGDKFFDDKIAYAYRYQATDTGQRFFIRHTDDAWVELSVGSDNHPVPEVYGERMAATQAMNLPVYDDMNDADPSVSSVAISVGQHPHGLWWHSGEQWYAGNRIPFTVDQVDMGGNDVEVRGGFAMPTDMELDIWAAVVYTIGGASGDVYLDFYNATTDEVLFEHGHNEHGNAVSFGNPHDVVQVDEGQEVQLRARNDDGGNVTFSGWLEWSFQEVL